MVAPQPLPKNPPRLANRKPVALSKFWEEGKACVHFYHVTYRSSIDRHLSASVIFIASVSVTADDSVTYDS